MAWDIIGHDHAVSLLERSIAAGRLSHAYLITGPPQVGKATLARNLAQALNCLDPEPGCGRCSSCLRISRNLHADVTTITLNTNGQRQHKDISIHQIREMERWINLQPYEGRYRVVTIDPADFLNHQAQNALLKTLEEPPPYVVFVLITSHPDALLPTVRSRCQQIELLPLGAPRVEEYLSSRYNHEPDQAGLIARLSRGRLGWAIAVSEQPDILSKRERTLEDLLSLPEAGTDQRFAYASSLATTWASDRQAVIDIIDAWLDLWRDILYVQAGCRTSVMNTQLMPQIEVSAGKFDLPSTVQFMTHLTESKRHLSQNANPFLALEMLLLELPSPMLVGGLR